MKTSYLIKKLDPILSRLRYEAEVKSIILLTYSDRLTGKGHLDLIVKVDLNISDNGGHEENCLSVIEFDSCQVDKIDIIDENGNPMCDGEQIKELVRHINKTVSNYYLNL